MAKSGRLRNHDPIADEIGHAIDRGDNDKAKELIQRSQVNVTDGYGRTPLIYAAFAGNEEMLQWLIEHKADLDAQDRNGWCSLHAAAQNRHRTIIMRLLKNGANPNLTDSYGNGPLWTATMNSRGDEGVTSLLMKAGADPGHKNRAGKSPADVKETIAKNLKQMAEKGNGN